MRPVPVIISAILLFLAGFTIGEFCFRGAPTRTGMASGTAATERTPKFEDRFFSNPDQTIRDSPRETLKALQSHPYLLLTPDQISALAARIDLSSQSERRLLNMAPPELKQLLWNECIRANLGSIPLEKLAQYMGESGIEMSGFPVFLDAILSSPDRDSILESGWMEPYLSGAFRYFAKRTGNLDELLKLLPPGSASPDFKANVVRQWSYAHPTAENFGKVIKIAPELPKPMRFIRDCALSLCSDFPSERAAVIRELTSLPDNSRNQILGQIILGIGEEDLSVSAIYLSSFTSFTYQMSAARSLLERHNPTERENLIRELDKVNNPASVAKLKAALLDGSGFE